LRIRDFELHRTGDTGQQARIANLPAALRVERRVIEHHLPFLPFAQDIDTLLSGEQRHDRAAIDELLVPREIGLGFDRDARAQVDTELARGAGALALRLHRRLEAGLIDREPTLARDV